MDLAHSPVKSTAAFERKEVIPWAPKAARQAMPLQYLTVVGGVALTTAAAFLITPVVGAHATALVYLLTVVALAMFVDRGAALLAAALSALCWDFFFLPPLFTFAIHSFEDAMLFVMYFVVALALGQLTNRINTQRLAEHRNRALLESARLDKLLLDSMSHELRTPIAVIQSATGNLLELGSAGLSGFQREMIDEIREASERLDRLVGNAMEMNRLESGAVKPKFTECDPGELVNFSVAEMEKRLARHRLSVNIEKNMPLVPMDFVLTQQAFVNLLSNAAAHTPADTLVEVSVRMEERALLLTVADRGPGIAPDVLPRVFDKFVRAPNAMTGGTGLGLSLVKGFVEVQGGTVQALNRSGGGAAFTIRLPLRQNPSDTATVSRQGRP
jgi:two-component system sensor histidine kinase KdpD